MALRAVAPQAHQVELREIRREPDDPVPALVLGGSGGELELVPYLSLSAPRLRLGGPADAHGAAHRVVGLRCSNLHASNRRPNVVQSAGNVREAIGRERSGQVELVAVGAEGCETLREVGRGQLQLLGDLLQEDVCVGVAEPIVRLLEVVDLDEGDPERTPLVDDLLDPFAERLVVAEPDQSIPELLVPHDADDGGAERLERFVDLRRGVGQAARACSQALTRFTRSWMVASSYGSAPGSSGANSVPAPQPGTSTVRF